MGIFAQNVTISALSKQLSINITHIHVTHAVLHCQKLYTKFKYSKCCRTSLTLLQMGQKCEAGCCFSQIKQMIEEDRLFNLSTGDVM